MVVDFPRDMSKFHAPNWRNGFASPSRPSVLRFTFRNSFRTAVGLAKTFKLPLPKSWTLALRREDGTVGIAATPPPMMLETPHTSNPSVAVYGSPEYASKMPDQYQPLIARSIPLLRWNRWPAPRGNW